jgi:hypothetical protein
VDVLQWPIVWASEDASISDNTSNLGETDCGKEATIYHPTLRNSTRQITRAGQSSSDNTASQPPVYPRTWGFVVAVEYQGWGREFTNTRMLDTQGRAIPRPLLQFVSSIW